MIGNANGFDDIAMAMQMAAFRAVGQNPVAGVDMDLARDGETIHQGIPTIL
jgi:hypothetical protein